MPALTFVVSTPFASAAIFVPLSLTSALASANTRVSVPALPALKLIFVALSILRHCVSVRPLYETVPFDVERLPVML